MIIEHNLYQNIPVYEVRHIYGWRVCVYIYPANENVWSLDWVADRDGNYKSGGITVESEPLKHLHQVFINLLMSLCEQPHDDITCYHTARSQSRFAYDFTTLDEPTKRYKSRTSYRTERRASNTSATE